ncbi:methyl-accepting chemotaxis protein [Candidatus Marinarcus aquaticus]|uniref:Chemotaxis protein n=1 Tax=Candidatus Marinarcus aquaticus TaxID=2044504 RepID=A0A4Q0XRJ0_9BACT|nr:methyl-accepting chemotaxis protein [Candidatus Marinarcus aquaticus]RXJ59946.1 chemotaxis protein [Candidatus Marinarcus aquaticus]
MFTHLNTKKKLFLFPLFFIVIVFFTTFIYQHYSSIANIRNTAASKSELLVQNLLNARIAVYQFLRNPSQQTALNVENQFEFLKKEVTVFQSGLSAKKNVELCDGIINDIQSYLNYFYTFSEMKIEQTQQANQTKDSLEMEQTVQKMVNIGLKIAKDLEHINQSAITLKEDAVTQLNTILIALVIIAIIIFILVSLVISNTVLKSIEEFKSGLLSFFNYLNREQDNISFLNDTSKDEFGEMAKVVNVNIQKTQKGIEEDRELIDQTITVLNEFESGDLCQRLEGNVSNPALQELKNVLNKMADNLENNIDAILSILEEYSQYTYLNRIKTEGLKEHLLKLATGVNSLGDSITGMLVESKTNGLILDNSSNILLKNVDMLNASSNEAASSLEETAAALEEITSNIRHNTDNIAQMATYSNNVTQSAQEGAKLANATNKSMDEINDQVNSINEAITVIDQIAFQTNILSLNAAVEAATAGEAGKGFAVVAQEVRNLASRSAEAAKKIKFLVENATTKANEGKSIASDMIEGYEKLNQNISQTIETISNIENASKEQLVGIEQINDAVNQLDQQTQQNAMVASQTHDVAIKTDSIAKMIVDDANKKEFKGKDSIHIEEEVAQEQIKKPKVKPTETVQKEQEWEDF